MYSAEEKVLFILEAAGNLTDQEVEVVRKVCPELSVFPPYHEIWRRRSRPTYSNVGHGKNAVHTEPTMDLNEMASNKVLTSLLDRIENVAGQTSSAQVRGDCKGDAYGNYHGIPPSPWMVDNLVSFIPRLDAQAREKYRQEVLEEPRKRFEPKKLLSETERGLALSMALFGNTHLRRAYREFVSCVLRYEERWIPPRYDKLLSGMKAGYGNVAQAMELRHLSFDQMRAILVSFARFSSRQYARITCITSGRLQRFLSRLGELREAENCLLLRPRKE